ncbi:hypothetical protein BDV26DRAFT_251912 [Aspergillus bertholletiae]|uniref:Uncharacterized protein n=1 Tax=Aspergillus bertholletiae TaxID=1226010 RepID=A0A5N7BNJ0_9EURO|nr:hypothetical protein BDV26DRAFT_251912 [Aspergillus bertholletiae]
MSTSGYIHASSGFHPFHLTTGWLSSVLWPKLARREGRPIHLYLMRHEVDQMV